MLLRSKIVHGVNQRPDAGPLDQRDGPSGTI